MKQFLITLVINASLSIPLISYGQITVEPDGIIVDNGFIYSNNSNTGSFIRFTPNQGIVLQAKNNTDIEFHSNIKFEQNFGIYNGLNKWAVVFSKDFNYGIESPVRFFETLSFGTLNIASDDPHITAEDYFELRYNADNDSQSGFKISKGEDGAPEGQHIDVLQLNSNDDLVIESGDLYKKSQNKGIVLVSPNGNCHRITVSNSGELETVPITCPN